MPYLTRKVKNKYCVYKKKTDGSYGDKIGCTSATKTKLKKYLNALYMNAHENKKSNLIKIVESILENSNEETEVSGWYDKDGNPIIIGKRYYYGKDVKKLVLITRVDEFDNMNFKDVRTGREGFLPYSYRNDYGKYFKILRIKK